MEKQKQKKTVMANVRMLMRLEMEPCPQTIIQVIISRCE